MPVDGKNLLPPYEVTPPPVLSWATYLFKTDSGMEYEVRFSRKQDNILHVSIAFGVTNEEFEGEEYVATNKGEMFRVMSTMVKIVRMYKEAHPHASIYEFMGEAREKEKNLPQTARIKLYYRYLPYIFDEPGWIIHFLKNHIVVTRDKDFKP